MADSLQYPNECKEWIKDKGRKILRGYEREGEREREFAHATII